MSSSPLHDRPGAEPTLALPTDRGIPFTPRSTTYIDRVAPRFSPVWLVLLGILSVQVGAAVAKGLFGEITPTGMVWLRLVTSALVLGVLARPRWRGRSAADWAVVVGFGVTLGVMNWAIYQAFARIPLGVAVTIEFIGPLGLAAAMSRKRRDLIAVAGAALGVVLVNGHELSEVDWLGVGFAALAGALWACYILLSADTGRRFAQLDGLALAMVVSTVLTAPIGLMTAGSELLHWNSLILGLAIAVLSSVLPYSLETLALRRMKPVVFGILMSIEPAVGATAGFLILSQRLAPIQLAGMACVVAASIAITRTSRSEAPDI